jgi:hypothetical protein
MLPLVVDSFFISTVYYKGSISFLRNSSRETVLPRGNPGLSPFDGRYFIRG